MPNGVGNAQKSKKYARGRSSVWLERLPVTQEVEGSSPFGPAGFPECPKKFGHFCFWLRTGCELSVDCD